MFGIDDGQSAEMRDLIRSSLRLEGDGPAEPPLPFAHAARVLGSMEHAVGGPAVLVPESSEAPAKAHGRLLIRACDIVIALIALIIMMPLMLLTSALVFITDPGPILFRHQRIGEGGRYFHCLKFRSMVCNADEHLRNLLAHDEKARLEWETYHKLTNDPRILPFGLFLRRSSLDELPQLWNVLRGDMSIVGPRPIVPDETWRYGRYLRHYLSCRPGITGLWQVSGRSNTTYRRRVALDVTWSRSQSFSFYCWILIQTVPSVLAAEGSA
jgi:lipopolysaccharide/colanic/teichoic acid biosynthesis glycosyltransferase